MDYFSYYENGNLKSEKNYIDDKLNGKYIRYHENGKLEIESNYINDKKEGIFKEYYLNGEIKTIEKYKIGKIITKKDYEEEFKLKKSISHNQNIEFGY